MCISERGFLDSSLLYGNKVRISTLRCVASLAVCASHDLVMHKRNVHTCCQSVLSHVTHHQHRVTLHDASKVHLNNLKRNQGRYPDIGRLLENSIFDFAFVGFQVYCFWFLSTTHPVRPTDYSSGKNASDRWMFVFFTESWPFICMHHDEIIRARSDVQMVAFVTESRPFFVTESWLFICMRHDEIIRARSGVTWPIHVCDMTRLYSALFEYQVFVCACVAVYCCEIPCVAVCWMKKTAFSACFP